MRRAGVIPVVAGPLHDEWMRAVAQSRAFQAAHPGFENPPGVLLLPANEKNLTFTT